jgi:LDH2 family malate/lactate/ureidoglycolate dehydrogenase
MDISIREMKENITNLLKKQGYTVNDAAVIADALMYAELRHNNQGIVKLITGALKSQASNEMEVIFETPVSMKINGNKNNGMVILKRAVEVAISKAKSNHISIVGCTNYASATGALGYWAREIANQGCIGIVMAQCPEMMAPFGSYEPIFGTNPIAIGIPTKPRSQVLDMATSAAAYYALVTAKEEGKTIPDDVAYDANGHPTTDPAEAMRGALRVFDRSFKGSHLALMVELLAGAFTGNYD